MKNKCFAPKSNNATTTTTTTTKKSEHKILVRHRTRIPDLRYYSLMHYISATGTTESIDCCQATEKLKFVHENIYKRFKAHNVCFSMFDVL